MYGYRVYKCRDCDYEFKAYEGYPTDIDIPEGATELYLYATYPMHCPQCSENYNIDGYKSHVYCENCGEELEFIISGKGIISTIFGAIKDTETDYFCPKCRLSKLIRKKGVNVLSL